MPKYVIITEETYKMLTRDYLKLQALECGGVDNWEWYGEALDEYLKEAEVENFDDINCGFIVNPIDIFNK